MAQYERFLSYLFEYENDEKGMNCGFAKIEVRGETKRIQITVKGKAPVELLHVCGFYREGNRCVCVPLGRMMVNGGTGQFQYVSNGAVLRGTGIPFERLHGLVLSNPQEKGRAYATVWDDDPFGLSMFEQEEPGQQEEVRQQGEDREQKDILPPKRQEQGQSEGQPLKEEERPEGQPPKGQERPEGQPPKEQGRPEGQPLKEQKRPEGRASKEKDGPEGRAPKEEERPEGQPSKEQKRPEGRAPKEEEQPEGQPPKEQKRPEGRASKEEEGPEGQSSKEQKQSEGQPPKEQKQSEGQPPKAQPEKQLEGRLPKERSCQGESRSPKERNGQEAGRLTEERSCYGAGRLSEEQNGQGEGWLTEMHRQEDQSAQTAGRSEQKAALPTDFESDSVQKGGQEEEDSVITAEECGRRQQDSGAFAENISETPEQKADELWLGLCRRFQRIESLPNDSVTCLKAIPADIGRLPRSNWIFGNNGFLMYSYVRYRYIVFARVSKYEFELWVPGTYGRNEELLAEMFGFSQFRSTKSSQVMPGDFGYWCVPLAMPGLNGAAGKANHTKEGAYKGYDTAGAAEAG